MNLLTPYWEYPATVWCAHCHEPLELTMSSSVDPAATLHGRVLARMETKQQKGNEMSTTPPTTAQEALDLAWNLAHPVKEGQHIPEGTRLLERTGRNDLSAYTTQANITINARESLTIRTLDPEPDWLDAPAVLATTVGNDNHRTFVNVGNSRWYAIGEKSYPWRELTDVTPLYPKEDR